MSLAADAKGRIWAVWTDGYVRRRRRCWPRARTTTRRVSAPAGRRWGGPKDAHEVYSVDASATDKRARRARGVRHRRRPQAARPTSRGCCPGLTLKAKKLDRLDDASRSPTPATPVKGVDGQGRRASPARPTPRAARRSTPQGHGRPRRPRGYEPAKLEAEVSYSVLPAGEAFWRPSNQMGVLNTDLGKQLGARGMGARFWRLRPGQASTKHRHRETHELYVVLEGEGRIRVDDDSLVAAAAVGGAASRPTSVRAGLQRQRRGRAVAGVRGAARGGEHAGDVARRRWRSSIPTGRRRCRRSSRR